METLIQSAFPWRMDALPGSGTAKCLILKDIGNRAFDVRAMTKPGMALFSASLQE
jgi:hypothetical protein